MLAWEFIYGLQDNNEQGPTFDWNIVKMLVVVVNLAKVLLKVMNQFSQLNEYYENDISQDLSAAVDTQNQNNDD